MNIYREQWEKVAAASVIARKINIVENCSNSLYPSQPDGACFEIAGRWSDAALCGCGRVGALTCPERASVVRASNSAERSARPVSGHLLRAPPRCGNIWKRLAGAVPSHSRNQASTHAVAGSSTIVEEKLVDRVIVRNWGVDTCQKRSEKSAAARAEGRGQRSRTNKKSREK